MTDALRDALQKTVGAQTEEIRRSMRYVEGQPGRGLFNFCKIGLGFRDLEWEVHGRFCAFFENAYFGRNRLVHEMAVQPYLVLGPRGSLKTSILTVGGPLWIICLNDPDPVKGGWEPPPAFNGKMGYNQRILISSETEENSSKMMALVKGHMTDNGLLRNYFGQAGGPQKKRKWSSIEADCRWKDLSTEIKEATLTRSSMQKVVNSGHYDIGFFDDMIGERSAFSEVFRDRAIENHKDMQSVLDKPSMMLYIGALWHDLDLYNYLTDKTQSEEYKKFVVLSVRSEPTEEQRSRGDNRVFWPKRFPQEVLDGLRETYGPWRFSCQYNNEVIDNATALFKKSYFEDTQFELDDRFMRRLRAMNVFTTCDPAISKDADACHAVITTCAWDHEGHCWLLDMFDGRGVDPSDYMEEVLRHNRVWKPTTVGIETTGFQMMMKLNGESMSLTKREYVPWFDLKDSKRRKEQRVEWFEPVCRQQKFHWQTKHHAIIHDFSRYPRGAIRDRIDCVAYQLDIAFRGSTPPPPVDPLDPINQVTEAFRTLGVELPLKTGRVQDFYEDA